MFYPWLFGAGHNSTLPFQRTQPQSIEIHGFCILMFIRRASQDIADGERGGTAGIRRDIERLAGLGAEPAPMTPEDFGRYVRQEVVKWAKVVKESGAKID